jgi:prepilin-type N-terminal cleavage/methylation domain-containing protein
MSARRRSSAGFTLVEILVVTAILGILMAIAFRVGVNALQRARQSKAMDDMADMAKYIATRAVGSGEYPAVLTIRSCSTCPWVPYERRDPWGNLYVYTGGGDTYTIRCFGRDGKPSAGITRATRDNFDLDIVMKDGHFVNEPYGT